MSTSFATALDSTPGWLLDLLQGDQDRFVLFLYDVTGKKYISCILGSGEDFPINEKKSTDLTWRLLRYVQFGVPATCYTCDQLREKGYVFQQSGMFHFLCISCLQGN